MTAVLEHWTQQTGRVLRHVDQGAGHRWLEIHLHADFPSPAPGQFVQILLANPSAVLLPRPMSVAAVSRRGRWLSLGFLYAPVGSGTRALAELAPGAALEVLGPLGHGYPLGRPGTPLLVAGGRGVAPLLFAADRLARTGRRCEFVFGARSRGHLVGLEDAEARLTSAGGTLHLCTDDGSRGFKGNVVEKLDELLPTLERPCVIYACGPHGMLKAVARWGMEHDIEAHLAMESVMACGTGVCRGCPLPRSASSRAAWDPDTTPSLYGNREFAMCCTEGPVFEAHDLDWEEIE